MNEFDTSSQTNGNIAFITGVALACLAIFGRTLGLEDLIVGFVFGIGFSCIYASTWLRRRPDDPSS